jgi:carboxypeptidase-like protein/TonB-dependent receptor-like protein
MTRARAFLILLLALPAPLAAQAVFTGRITSDSTKQPIPGVQVVLEKPATRAESDAEGRFSIGGIPWGIQMAVIRKIGYRPIRLRLFVAGDDTVDVGIRLEAAGVQLEPIEVTAGTFRPGMEDYARRKLAGFGRFYDSKALSRAEGRRLSDFLQGTAGVRVVSRGLRAVLVSSRSNCPMAVWLDGLQLSGGSRRVTQDINEFPISQLEGVEVYSGSGGTPVELMGTGTGSCGTVALWTRRGR